MPKLEMHHSLSEAQKVLDIVMADSRIEELNDSYTVRVYQNGREQGFSIEGYNWVNFKQMAITWAQQRNSDDIVIYLGPPSSSSISEEAYENAKFFKNENCQGAVNYIVEQLIIIDSTKVQWQLTKEAK